MNSSTLQKAAVLFHSGRMFIGVIHPFYVLSLGHDLATVAWLQLIFSTTVLLGEYPTGLLADVVSRRLSVLVGSVLTSLLFFCYFEGSNIYVLALGEVFYGLGACFLSGALQGWMRQVLQTDNELQLTNESTQSYFLRQNEQIMLGSLIAGAIGAIPAFFSVGLLKWTYLVAGITVFASFFIFRSIGESSKPEARHTGKGAYWKTVCESLEVTLKSRIGLSLLGFSMLMTLIVQPLYHYWQPFIMEVLKSQTYLSASGIQGRDLMVVLLTFVGYNAANYVMARRLRSTILHRLPGFQGVIMLSTISAILLAALSLSGVSNIALVIVIFSIFNGTVSLCKAAIDAQHFDKLPERTFSSVLSIVSLFSRLAAVAMLAYIGGKAHHENLMTFFNIDIALFLLVVLLSIHQLYLGGNYGKLQKTNQ